MAVAVAGKSALVVQATGPFTTIVVNKPSGVVDGDLLVVFVTDQGSTQATDFTSPGWTRVGPAFIGSSANTRVTDVFYKAVPSAAAESATTYTFTSPSSVNRRSIICYRLTGVDLTNPVNASSAVYGFTTTAGTTQTWVNPAATAAGLMVAFTQAQFSSPNVNTLTSVSPSMTTEDYNLNPVGAGTGVSRTTTGTFSNQVASGASSVTETITYGGSAASSAGFAVLFQAATLAVSGTAQSTSSTAGAVVDSLPLSGTAQSTSSTAGAVLGIGVLAGSATSASATSGVVIATGVLTGTAASASSTTAAVIATGVLQGTAGSVSATAGTQAASVPMSGSAASTSSTAGAETAVDSLTGSASSASSTTGTQASTSTLTGAAASTTTTAGAVSVGGSFVGAAASVSSTSGAITSAVRSYSLDGAAASTSATAGAVAAVGVLTGAAVTVSSTSGVITATVLLTGTAASASATAGTLTASLIVGGLALSVTVTTGAVGVGRFLPDRSATATLTIVPWSAQVHGTDWTATVNLISWTATLGGLMELIPHLSKVAVPFTVSAARTIDGAAPTVGFIRAEGSVDDVSDFATGSWSADPGITRTGYVMIGPGGHELLAGLWDVYVRYADSFEAPLMMAGTIRVT